MVSPRRTLDVLVYVPKTKSISNGRWGPMPVFRSAPLLRRPGTFSYGFHCFRGFGYLTVVVGDHGPAINRTNVDSKVIQLHVQVRKRLARKLELRRPSRECASGACACTASLPSARVASGALPLVPVGGAPPGSPLLHRRLVGFVATFSVGGPRARGFPPSLSLFLFFVT